MRRCTTRDRLAIGAALASEAACAVGIIAWMIARPAVDAPFTILLPFGFVVVASYAVAVCIARVVPLLREESRMSHFD